MEIDLSWLRLVRTSAATVAGFECWAWGGGFASQRSALHATSAGGKHETGPHGLQQVHIRTRAGPAPAVGLPRRRVACLMCRTQLRLRVDVQRP